MKTKAEKRQSRWVAGALIIASAAIVIVLLWFYNWAPPSRADFRNAQGQTDVLMEQMMAADSAANAYAEATVSSLRFQPDGKGIAADTKQERSRFDASMSSYKAQMKRLERSPVTRDKEVAPVVKQLASDTARFRGYLNTFVAEYPTYYKTQIGCDELNRFNEAKTAAATSDSYSRVAKKCLATLDVLAKSNLAALREYAAARAEIVKATDGTYAGLTKEGADKVTLGAQLDDLKARASALDPLSDIRHAHDEIMNHELFDTLTELLKKKQQV